MENSAKAQIAMVRSVKKLGCAFQDVEAASNHVHLVQEQKVFEPQLSSSVHPRGVTFCRISGKKGPSLGFTQPSSPHERSFFAPKFDDRFQEETINQERWARRAA